MNMHETYVDRTLLKCIHCKKGQGVFVCVCERERERESETWMENVVVFGVLLLLVAFGFVVLFLLFVLLFVVVYF